MEGLESFCGLMELGRSTDEDDAGSLNATTPDGRRYEVHAGQTGGDKWRASR
jgi:hypothetical protein